MKSLIFCSILSCSVLLSVKANPVDLDLNVLNKTMCENRSVEILNATPDYAQYTDYDFFLELPNDDEGNMVNGSFTTLFTRQSYGNGTAKLSMVHKVTKEVKSSKEINLGISFYERPEISIVSPQEKNGKIDVCRGVIIELKAETESQDIVSYFWNIGINPTEAGNPLYKNSDEIGTVNNAPLMLEVRDRFGCMHRYEKNAYIKVKEERAISPQISIELDGSAASNRHITCKLPTDYRLNSETLNNPDVISYRWRLPDGTVITSDKNPAGSIDKYGQHIFTVSVEDKFGCVSDQAAATVNVLDYKANARITVKSGSSPVNIENLQCIGNYSFEVAGINFDSVSWYLNGVFHSDEKTINLDLDADAKIRAEVKNSQWAACEAEIETEIKIEPEAEISLTADKYFWCQTETINFEVKSNLDDITVSSFFPADSTLFTDRNFAKKLGPGIHTVEFSANSEAACKPINSTITVEIAAIDGTVYIEQERNRCIPQDIRALDSTAYNPSDPGLDKIKNYTWDWGDTNNSGTYNQKQAETGHTYTAVGKYRPQLTIETELGCKYRFIDKRNIYSDGSFKVGDTVTPGYELENTTVCANGEVLYRDKSENRNLIEQVFVSAISESQKHFANAEALEKVTYGQETFITGFDTVGRYDLGLSLIYHACTTRHFQSNAMTIRGPVGSVGKVRDCSKAWNLFGFYADKKILADDNCSWQIKNVANGQIVLEEDKSINDTLWHEFAEPGIYEASLFTKNDTTGCQHSYSIRATVEKVQMHFNIARQARCIEDSLFLFEKGDKTLAFTGIDTVESFRLLYQPPGKTEFDTTWVLYDITAQMAFTSDSIKFSQTGLHQLQIEYTDKNSCLNTQKSHFKVYGITAKASTQDTAGCLPLGVKYLNESIADTTLARFTWETNIEDLGLQYTTSVSDPMEVTYTSKEKPWMRLIAETVSTGMPGTPACRDTFEINGDVKLILPFVGYKYTDKVCLGSLFEATKGSSEILDSVIWDFNGDKINNTSDTVNYSFENEGQYEIKLLTGLQTEYGYCTNDTVFAIDIRAYELNLTVEEPENKCYLTAEWKAMANGDWSDMPRPSFTWYKLNEIYTNYTRDTARYTYYKNPGRHYIKVEMRTPYAGCTFFSDSIAVEALGAKIDFELDKDTICVGEELRPRFKDTTNMDITGFQWIFGSGSSDSTNMEPVIIYDRVPALGYYTVRTVQNQGCAGRYLNPETNQIEEFKESDEKRVYLYKLESRFDINGNDSDIAGCPPLKVSLENRSLLSDGRYEWDLGQGGAVFTGEKPDSVSYSKTGQYTVSLKVEDKNCKHTFSRKITVHQPAEDKFIGPDYTVCQNKEAEIIHRPGTGSGTSLFEWSPSEFLSNASIASPQVIYTDTTRTFYISVTTKDGCKLNDSVEVPVQQIPKYSGAPTGELWHIRNGMPVKFRATDTIIALENYLLGNDSMPNIKYKWHPAKYVSCDSCANPLIYITEGIDIANIELIMKDNEGCFEEKVILMFNIIKKTQVGVPSAFTPNGDGVNDFLYVRGWAIRELLEFRIFNRWGQEVFFSDNMDIPWDGNFNTEPQPTDTYAYTLKIIDFDGNEIFAKGDFQLIR
jgi:gliding motility-associated-like protein